MPGLSYKTNEITPGPWLAQPLDGDDIMPFPVKLNTAEWPLEDGDIVALTAAAAAGAIGLVVSPLVSAIPADTILEFGTFAPVTVTVADAGAVAGNVSLGVAALSGPIPSGTTLDFSAGVNAQLVRLSADAATGAVTLAVEPLDGAIANATTALFAGGTIQARVTTAAAAAATALVVDELQFAIASAATATYGGSGKFKRRVRGGTYVGRTYAERLAGTSFGPVASGDEERYLLAFDVKDLDANDTGAAVAHQIQVKENYLPTWATLSLDATVLAYLRLDYQTTIGAA
ncbi:MAG TPA: hypothetical protein VIU62_11230 [Chloroflexota bacterium]|jgi:hypothetical protein